MKLSLILVVVLLTGCASMDRAVCYGTGTCDRIGVSSVNTLTRAANTSTMPYSVNLPSGSYLVVPNHSTGRVMSVIQTSRAK